MTRAEPASRPRGVRNHNPGNIERLVPRTPWQGRVPDGQTTDPRFEQFISPEWGIRALARTLITYQDKHGLDTIAGIIGRWAPPVENDTAAYVRYVAHCVGVEPTAKIDLQQYAVMHPLCKAIIRHENGIHPYSDSVIAGGLLRAGVVPDKVRPVYATKTVGGASIMGLGGLGPVVTEGAQQLGVVAEVSPTFKVVFGVLMVIGFLLTVYGKLDSRTRGGV